MATFDPASEPLGSSSPLVRDLNTRNLDRGLHSEDDTWPDRFGEQRKTWRAIETEVEGLLIAGGKIFETEAAGRAAADNGQYFFAESPDPGVSKSLYQRVSESESRWVADDPSVEFVRAVSAVSDAAIETASIDAEFYTDEAAQPAYAITDEDGRALAAWDSEGYQISQERCEFHTKDDQPAYAITDEDGNVFYSIDSQGRNLTGGGTPGNLPFSPQEVPGGRLWRDGQNVEEKPSYDSLYFTPVETLFPTHVQINEAFQTLADDFPDYVTSNLLSTDEWGNEIWEFDFKPPGQSSHFSAYPDEIIKLQKHLIIGGVHAGTEKHAIVANYIFFNQLCREWQQWDRLDTFRWDVEFKIIPCLVPTAFDDGTRGNRNGVDINRNFPTNWEITTQSTRGPSPASELETQLLIAWVDDNLDADMIVDHHRNRNLQNDQFGWIGTNSTKGLGLAIKTVNEIVAYGKKHFDFIPQDNSTVRFVGRHIYASTVDHFHSTTDIESYLLETVRDVAGAPNAIYTRRYLAVEALKIFLWNYYEKRQREREEFMLVPVDENASDEPDSD